MSALSAALCRRGIILWLAAVLLLASRSTHSGEFLQEYLGTLLSPFLSSGSDASDTLEPPYKTWVIYLKEGPWTHGLPREEMGGIGGEEIFSLVRRRDRIISASAGSRITIRDPSINAAKYAINRKKKNAFVSIDIVFTLFHDPRRTPTRSRILQ